MKVLYCIDQAILIKIRVLTLFLHNFNLKAELWVSICLKKVCILDWGCEIKLMNSQHSWHLRAFLSDFVHLGEMLEFF